MHVRKKRLIFANMHPYERTGWIGVKLNIICEKNGYQNSLPLPIETVLIIYKRIKINKIYSTNITNLVDITNLTNYFNLPISETLLISTVLPIPSILPISTALPISTILPISIHST